MVKAMLEMENSTSCSRLPLKILCLCYTNHALDSFLLDLINAGIPKELFIRLGSSPKMDPKIKARSLGEVSNDINTDFGIAERAAYAKIKQEYEKLEERFKKVLKTIENSRWGVSDAWWQRINTWIDDNYYEEYDQLQVPELIDSDGFLRTGKSGKKLKSNYLWERWCNGEDRGIFEDEINESSIWTLNANERKLLIDKWNQEWIQPEYDLLDSTIESLQKNVEALRSLRRNNDLRVLANALIIGCTTVSAAKFQGMINPTIVIVEEAGEILESHVLGVVRTRIEIRQSLNHGNHRMEQ